MATPSKQFRKYKSIIDGGKITEQEVRNLQKLLNGWSKSSTTLEERDYLNDLIWNADGLTLTAEQTAKGIKWLRDQWKTPRGQIRKHNPFGYREEAALETFTHFTFVGFYDLARVHLDDGRHQYTPIWDVFGADGYFQYYMARGGGYNGGSVEIIG